MPVSAQEMGTKIVKNPRLGRQMPVDTQEMCIKTVTKPRLGSPVQEENTSFRLNKRGLQPTDSGMQRTGWPCL